MTSTPAHSMQAGSVLGIDEARPHAPTSPTLVQILQERRSALLTELRDVEQTIEHLEANPTFEGTFQRVSKILNRGKW